MRPRDYHPSDRTACLEIFRSNVPLYFAAGDEAEFLGFLDNLPGPYIVMEKGPEIIACGGYGLEPSTGTASLCWGMVRQDQHRQGLGRFLLETRLRHMTEVGQVRWVLLNTSQHTQGFYEKYGFRLLRKIPNGYGDGLDRCEMRLELNGGGSNS